MGIPKKIKHVNLENTCLNIFNKVSDYKISNRDIVNCHRISEKSDTVVIKFLNTRDAVSFLDKNENIQKLENEDNGLDYKNIYLNEHLTPYISNLAYKCRCLKRKGKIAKANLYHLTEFSVFLYFLT